jgi:hypothetical protein
MPNPLLSPYRGGENRVTSSTMAVFERVDLALAQELLEAATGAGGELRSVTFENQVGGDTSVPDARISGRFTWWFETKTSRGCYATEGHNRQQLREHGALLADDPDARLFVLTPDPERPAWFATLDGMDTAVRDQVLWVGFRDLADATNSIIADPTRLLGEQTRFLLSELVALYEIDGLLTSDDTVIVAARAAWPEYQKLSAYVCQPNRTFRDGLRHFGFYADGAIQPLIPRIRTHYPVVPFTDEEADRRRDLGDNDLADLIDHLLGAGARTKRDAYGVVLLTRPHDTDTVQLGQPIENDTRTASGRPMAWTRSQRYTRLDRLRSGVTRTSEL